MRFLPEPGSPPDRAATFIMANLFWFMFAAPIITLPMATAGLFAALAPWVRGQDVEFFGAFFGNMRRQWFKSTVLTLFDVLIGGWLFLNFQIINDMPIPEPMKWGIRGINISIALIVLMMNMYMWTLMVTMNLPLRRLFNVGWRFALGHPFWSILIVLLSFVPITLGQFAPIWLNVMATASSTALIINWGAWRIIKKYATPEELAEINLPSG